ncbi:MAG: DNA repair protein RadC [Candidatus Altiarchaeota archaeon]
MRIKDLPLPERPRERLINFGAHTLSNAELLAILLRTGTKEENVINLAMRILKEYNLKKLAEASVIELMKIPGVGEAKACQIAAAFELVKRLDAYPDKKRKIIRNAEDVTKIFLKRMQYLDKEYFRVVFLDTRNKIIKHSPIANPLLRYKTVSVGGLNESIVHPREVFKEAIKESANSIILVHNHPSGDPMPSKDDIEITKRLIEVGKLVGIEVLDHIIIGNNCYKSLKEEGFIK